jgi:hypothetical protein
VVWWDGSASMFWRGEERSMTYFCGGVSAIEAIHGHGGSTWVHYLADPGGLDGLDDPADIGSLVGRVLRVLREGCRRAR